MRIVSTIACVLSVAIFVVSLAGCGDKAEKAQKGKAPAAHSHDGLGEHAHDGCDEAHQNAVKGPHGGHLIVLEENAYQAELLQDEKTKTVTVYLLAGDGKKAVAVAQKEIALQLLLDGKFVKYVLKAASEKDTAGKDATTPGTASRFEIVDEKLVDSLDHDKKSKGRLQVTIDGKPYSGKIEISGHTHGDHDHGNQDHDTDKDHDHGKGTHDDHDHAKDHDSGKGNHDDDHDHDHDGDHKH